MSIDIAETTPSVCVCVRARARVLRFAGVCVRVCLCGWVWVWADGRVWTGLVLSCRERKRSARADVPRPPKGDSSGLPRSGAGHRRHSERYMDLE